MANALQFPPNSSPFPPVRWLLYYGFICIYTSLSCMQSRAVLMLRKRNFVGSFVAHTYLTPLTIAVQEGGVHIRIILYETLTLQA